MHMGGINNQTDVSAKRLLYTIMLVAPSKETDHDRSTDSKAGDLAAPFEMDFEVTLSCTSILTSKAEVNVSRETYSSTDRSDYEKRPGDSGRLLVG